MRRPVVLLLALAAGLWAAPGAAAAFAADPDDTGGRLDLRRVTATRSALETLTVTVRTWGAWPRSVLPRTGSPNRLLVLFDTDADGAAEFRARIVLAGGSLVALLSGQGQQFEPIPVTRPSAAHARFAFPADVLVSAGEDLGVAARSVYRGGPCSVSCVDRAPDAGWAALPGESGQGGGGYRRAVAG